MFAVDYPYVLNKDGMYWIKELQLSVGDKRKLVGDNARRLLKL
jgi:2,3-dihydroxybenzoate decarboxylase